MQDTRHKRTESAVPRLFVVVLVFCLCVAMALPSTTAALITVSRLDLIYAGVFSPVQVDVSSKDQLEFRGIDGENTLRIQFSSSCRDDLVDDGVEVKDKDPMDVNTLFSRSSSRTAFAAFEKIGCKPGNMVKINLLDHVTPPHPKVTPSPKTAGKNSTESSSSAKNATESSHSEDENHRNARNANSTSHADNEDNDNRKVSNSSLSNNNVVHANNNGNTDSLSPTMAAVIGSAVTLGFASIFAVGFLVYRRRHRIASGDTNDHGGRHLDNEPLTATKRDVTPDSPDSKELNPYPMAISNAGAPPSPYPMMMSNVEAPYPMVISNVGAPQNPYPMIISNAEAPRSPYPMMISSPEAPSSPHTMMFSNAEPSIPYPMVISNAEGPSSLYPMLISNNEAPSSPYPMMFSNAEAPSNSYPTVISNNEASPNSNEAPPFYGTVINYQMTSLDEVGGSDTNHEVIITDTNYEVGHSSVDT